MLFIHTDVLFHDGNVFNNTSRDSVERKKERKNCPQVVRKLSDQLDEVSSKASVQHAPYLYVYADAP